MRRSLCAVFYLTLALLPAAAFGQSRLSGLISPEAAARAGLVRQWNTQIEVNRGNSRVEHITQYVSDVTNQQVFEVVAGNEVYRFSDRDRDAFGDMIRKDGAKSRATDKFNQLEAAGKKPVVKSLVVPDVFLYVVTNRGIIHAINGETGETLWVQAVGNSDYPTTSVAANEATLAVCNGSTIYVLDRRTGLPTWQRETAGSIATGPSLTKEMVSVPLLNGSMETYRTDTTKRFPPYAYRSQGAIYHQPIVTPRNTLAWTTDQGHMLAADGTTGKPRFRLETSDTIIGGVAYLLPRYLYVASFDGYVYCVDEVNGNQLWRYSCGATVSKTPVAVGETVYVVTDDHQLHALDYKTGTVKAIRASGAAAAAAPAPAAAAAGAKKADPAPLGYWPVVNGVSGVLTVTPTKVYCLGRPGQLLILDATTGGVLGTMPIGNQDFMLHNSVTDRIIIGTTTGTLQCLRERHLGFPYGPYVHVNEAEKLKATRADVVQEVEKPMEAEKPMPMENDPFGGGAKPKPEADPFGNGPAKPAEDDPFGAPAPKKNDKPVEDDPFK